MKGSLRRILAIIIGALWAAVTVLAETDLRNVIVFPLYGAPKSEAIRWVGEGIAESLSVQLRLSRLHVMDGGQVTELMEDMGFSLGAQLSRGSLISIAHRESVDAAVMGSFEGTEKNIAISLVIYYPEEFKLSGNISANGPLSVLPQIENELAWQIVTDIGTEGSLSREQYYERTRKIPNTAYGFYIQSFSASSENERRDLLLNAVKAYDDFPEAQFQLGNLYYRNEDFKSALLHLAPLDNENDAPMKVKFMIGTCYLRTGQPQLAVEAYSNILRDSRPFEVLNNLGVAYLQGSQNELALDAFGEAHMLIPANSTISLNLAIAHQIQGNISAALTTAEEAIEINPKNGMLQLLLGFLLKNQGDDKGASVALQEAENLGVPVKKVSAQDPKTWIQEIPYWTSSEIQ